MVYHAVNGKCQESWYCDTCGMFPDNCPGKGKLSPKGLSIRLFVLIALMFGIPYLINVTSDDHDLRHYNHQIHEIERKQQLKADTEAARLKLIELRKEQLRELEGELK